MEDEKPEPPRRRNIGFAATWALVIGFTCLAVGQFAEQVVGLPPARVADSGAGRPQFGAIDYAATGAIKARALSPCGPQPNGP